MANAAQIVAAFRDVASTKSLSDEEMTDLVKDGILAGLARIYGPTVQAEIDIHEDTGEFDIVVLRRVVEEVEDTACEISLEEARWDDDTFEVGDVMEIPGGLHAVRPQRRHGREAAHRPAGPRERAGPHPRRVRRPGRRAALRRGPADRARQARGHDEPFARRRSDHSVEGAEPT